MISKVACRILKSVLLLMVCHLGKVQVSYAQNASKKLPSYKVESIGDSIQVLNASNRANGYWIYFPVKEVLPANNVVVFMHGYGAYNPLIFGAWIRHLVKNGNIVIYPRYQKTLLSPRPKQFVNKTLTGLKNALLTLKNRGWDESLWSEIDLVGHSYGGVISMNLAEKQEDYNIPPIQNIMICSAGTGPFKAGILENYDKVDANLIMITSQFDTTVGSKFTKRVERLTQTKTNKVYLNQRSMKVDSIKLTSHHNEPYALDAAFDNKVRNYTVKKAFRVGDTNILDMGGYWQLFDQLITEGETFIQTIQTQNKWSLSNDYPELKLDIKDLK